MIISLIVAMDECAVIGKDNDLPWHLPADLKNFKKLTMGKPIIMGRKTYDSIGRPLPGRLNIVVTRQRNLKLEGCVVVHSLDDALVAAKSTATKSAAVEDIEEVMIIGGSEIFIKALSIANRIYLTVVHSQFEGDIFFPEFDLTQWQISTTQTWPADEKNAWPHTLFTLDRPIVNTSSALTTTTGWNVISALNRLAPPTK